jgi:hypothetical protein
MGAFVTTGQRAVGRLVTGGLVIDDAQRCESNSQILASHQRIEQLHSWEIAFWVEAGLRANCSPSALSSGSFRPSEQAGEEVTALHCGQL